MSRQVAKKRPNGSGEPMDVDDDQADIDMSVIETVQDEEERRKLRSNIRNIMDELRENEHELINPESTELTNKLDVVDKLFKKEVKMTREAALDSQAMVMISTLGRKKAQALNTEFFKFNPYEFINKVVKVIKDSDYDGEPDISSDQWEKFGADTQPFFNKSPTFDFMFGTFEPGEVHLANQRKQRSVKDKDTNDKKVQVKEITKAEDAATTEATTREVGRIYEILKQQFAINSEQPLCYFAFVTNPHSFGQTVENIFHVSFLIKDGLATISLDEDKLPVIEPCDDENDAGTNPQEQKRHQQVMVMTMKIWKDIVDAYAITEPLIPERAVVEPTAGTSGGSNHR